MMSANSLHNIVEGFRDSNEMVIRQLYDLYYRSLCYFADQLINDKAVAEDIAVDSFLKLLNKKDDFNSLAEIKSFLYKVTRNACFDVLRKKKSRDRYNRELAYMAEPDEMFGDQEMITAKVLQVIYAEVENLPGQCKQVFKSIFMEGKTTATVALEMGISPQTVLNQKSKAVHSLRLALYKEGLYSISIIFFCLIFLHNNHHG